MSKAAFHPHERTTIERQDCGSKYHNINAIKTAPFPHTRPAKHLPRSALKADVCTKFELEFKLPDTRTSGLKVSINNSTLILLPLPGVSNTRVYINDGVLQLLHLRSCASTQHHSNSRSVSRVCGHRSVLHRCSAQIERIVMILALVD